METFNASEGSKFTGAIFIIVLAVLVAGIAVYFGAPAQRVLTIILSFVFGVVASSVWKWYHR